MLGDAFVGDVLVAPWAVISIVLALKHVSQQYLLTKKYNTSTNAY